MRPGNSAKAGLKLAVRATLFSAIVLLLVPSVARAQQPTGPKGVLVLYWGNKDFPFSVAFDQSFQARLQSAPAGTVEYFGEYLDYNRFPGEDQDRVLGADVRLARA